MREPQHAASVSDGTTATLRVAIGDVGSGAKTAAFGMQWGSKAQLDKLGAVLHR